VGPNDKVRRRSPTSSSARTKRVGIMGLLSWRKSRQLSASLDWQISTRTISG